MGWIAPILVFVMLAAPALRLWRSENSAERNIAIFFLASALGLALRLAAVRNGSLGAGSAGGIESVANTFGHLGLTIACIALFNFTRIVFRPAAAWACWVQRAGSAGAILAFCALFLDHGLVREEATSVLVANSVRAASFAWCFAEALHYWTLMRRRLAMRLADPIVANRFGLWSVWTGCLTATLVFVLAGRIGGALMDVDGSALPAAMPFVRAFILACIGACMTAIWLSFFPPSRYLDWIEKRNAAPSVQA